ncbi:MAG: glycosyltransferase family 9 protein, partial [Acidobacteria bacterium]|nr:glycosyltransferase family 9 protein [Acidobacteriota bacterium]
MRPERGGETRRVLAVRLDNLGDVVMTGPAIRALRDRWPDASITLLSSPAGAAAARMLPWIDEILPHRAVWQDASNALPLDPSREQAFIEALAARRFEAAFIFTSFSQSPWPAAYACYLAGIPLRAGHSHGFGGSLLTVQVPPMPDSSHQVDRNAAVVEAAGIAVADRRLDAIAPAGARESARRALAAIGIGKGDPFAVVTPGASCTARRYSPARFAEAASSLAGLLSCPVVIT